jgi:hypothetical protein
MDLQLNTKDRLYQSVFAFIVSALALKLLSESRNQAISMANQITIEELVVMHMYQWEALMRVLEQKGLVTNMEVMEEIEKLRAENDALENGEASPGHSGLITP